MINVFVWFYLAAALWFTFRISKADTEVVRYLNFTASLLLLILSTLTHILTKL